MKQTERDALARAFEPPKPWEKRTFLRSLPQKRDTAWKLLWVQFQYIRPWTWGLSALVFISALLIGRTENERGLWWISAMTPFLAMALVTELARSSAYGMEELELATRFSLKTVVLGRMVLLGLSDLVVLAVLLVSLPSPAGTLRVGLHLVLPYLSSALLGLRLVRRMRGTEGFLAALAAACLVGCGAWAVEAWVRLPLSWWLLAAVALMVWTVRECRSVLTQSEEYVWNC